MLNFRTGLRGAVAVTMLALACRPVALRAVPSFARQTGMDCAACHTVFPELNSFGRQFKLSGYTMGVKKLTGADAQGDTRLSIGEFPPLAAMFQAGQSSIAKSATNTVQADTDKNGVISFPAQFSLFFAGAISTNMGAFVQATYDSGSGLFHFDNTDVRWAARSDLLGGMIYGVSINNNPTVQDVWNSTPAWGFPYIQPTGSNVVGPAGSSQIESLGGQVGSLGAYAYVDDLIYLEASTYRSIDPLGGAYSMQGYSPYWRLALQQDFGDVNAELGTFGMAVNNYPTAIGYVTANAPMDSYTDFGVDSQIQYVTDDHIVSLSGSWIRESQDWNASNALAATQNPNDQLNRLKLTGTYYFRRKLGASVGYFSTTGSQDTLLYGSGSASGSTSGIPTTNGMVYELNYLPWYNTKFALQYTAYNEFNGGTTGYTSYADDSNPGSAISRNAWDNNTLMLSGWLMY
jgi:hypothetical protein